MWSGLFAFSLGSNTTRLLNTPMKGWTTEMVDSSWIEAEGGLSRWEMRNVPPCFCAKAGDAVVTNTPAIKAAVIVEKNAKREPIDVLPDPYANSIVVDWADASTSSASASRRWRDLAVGR